MVKNWQGGDILARNIAEVSSPHDVVMGLVAMYQNINKLLSIAKHI
jgi:hypothetical protein